jgi:2',3'-cyclic-nucleotide 2'-phosphodiesterase (5'-nucleotidase family)
MIQASLLSLSVNFGLLATLMACAHGGSGGGWPKSNPFEGSRSISVDQQLKDEVAALKPLRILFSGNVNGETEPCGCAVNPKGGLDRRLNYVQSLSSKPMPTVMVDAGNAWFAHERIDASNLERFKAKAEFLMRSQRLMGLEVHNVGRLDLSAGLDWLKASSQKAGLKLTSLSLLDAKTKKPIFDDRVVMTVGQVEVVVIGLSAGRETVTRSNSTWYFRDDSEAALREALATVSAQQFVIVLSDLGLARDRELAKTLRRPVLIVGSRDLSSFEIPEQVGQALIVQGQYQGQQWGRIDLAQRSQSQGWYNVLQGKAFAEEWPSRVAARQAIVNKAPSESRTSELANLDLAYKDLARFAPKDVKSKTAFEYWLVNMTPEWSAPNELTKQMKAFQR